MSPRRRIHVGPRGRAAGRGVYSASMRRELIITLDGRECVAVVEPHASGPWRVSLDGRERLVDARRVRPGTWSLLVDGRSYLVDLDERKQGLGVLVGKVDTVVEVDDARRKRLARAVAQGETSKRGETIRAPIAGKVVKVLVAPGDQVAANQSVVVLEAMKMENEIRSESGGTVASVQVTAGQSVETHDTLVTLA
jgi:biotin carboxyl carrier protein